MAIQRVFDDIELEWDGKTFVVPSNRVMGAIARIEDVITLPELYTASQKGGVPLGKLARGFGSVLRYAGARVSDEELYQQLFSDATAQQTAIAAVQTLIMMMIPPAQRKAAEEEASAGNTEAGETTEERPPQE